MFKLDNAPDYLMSENGNIFSFPINHSDFVQNDSYVLDAGTTPVVTKSKYLQYVAIQIQNPKIDFNFLASTIGFRNEC